MRFEIPEFKRCCFCLPLRYGLLIWSYLLLVPLGLALAGTIFMITHYLHRSIFIWEDVFWTTISFLFLISNIVLNFLLIVAAHKKSVRLLKMYYMCSLVSAFTNFIYAVGTFVYDMVTLFHVIQYLLVSVIICLLLQLLFIVMQVYIIILVRSEIMKLENNHSFKFFNNAAEAEMEYYNPDSVQDVVYYGPHLIENTITKESREKEKEAEEIRVYV